MKKFLFITAALFVVAVVFSSCKGHETCPAYGKIDTKQINEIPS